MRGSTHARPRANEVGTYKCELQHASGQARKDVSMYSEVRSKIADHVARVLCDLGPRDPHSETDIRRLECGSVVRAVARHRHDLRAAAAISARSRHDLGAISARSRRDLGAIGAISPRACLSGKIVIPSALSSATRFLS